MQDRPSVTAGVPTRLQTRWLRRCEQAIHEIDQQQKACNDPNAKIVTGVPSKLEHRLRARYEKALREIEIHNPVAQKQPMCHSAIGRMRRSSHAKDVSSFPKPPNLHTANDSSISLTTDCLPTSTPSSDENQPLNEQSQRHRRSINGKRRQQHGGRTPARLFGNGGPLCRKKGAPRNGGSMSLSLVGNGGLLGGTKGVPENGASVPSNLVNKSGVLRCTKSAPAGGGGVSPSVVRNSRTLRDLEGAPWSSGTVSSSAVSTGDMRRDLKGVSESATASSVQGCDEQAEYPELNRCNALAESVTKAQQNLGLKHSAASASRSAKSFEMCGEAVAHRDAFPEGRPATPKTIPRAIAALLTRTPRGRIAESGLVSSVKSKANSGRTTGMVRGERLNRGNANAMRPQTTRSSCPSQSFMRSKSADPNRFQLELSMFNPEQRLATRQVSKTASEASERRQGPTTQRRSLLERDATSDSQTSLVAVPSRACTTMPLALDNCTSSSAVALSAALPLSEEERIEYGDRWACENYVKKKLLGRGGSALVWLAHGHCGMVAVKQISKGDLRGRCESAYLSAKSEIRIGELLFDKGKPTLNPDQFPGVHHIVQIFSHVETKKDLWVIQEFGGEPMSRCLFEIKGEFTRNEFRTERIYRVHHKVLMEKIKHDASVARNLLSQLLLVLNVLLPLNLVHSDLKPDNVLISNAGQPNMLVRVCDFGSAFAFDDPVVSNAATPEYMPPEAFRYNQHQQAGIHLRTEQHPWSFDIWSVGMMFLEIVHGAPLWLPYKCRIRDESGDLSTMGLLSVNRRDLDKLAIKQKAVVEDLMRVMRCGAGAKSIGSCPLFQTLLRAILRMDPLVRASPDECLEHPWMAPSERRGSY